MELLCFPLMSKASRTLMEKRYRFGGGKYNREYRYRPQYRLIQRLSRALNISESQVREQIYKERLYLLREKYGYDQITPGSI